MQDKFSQSTTGAVRQDCNHFYFRYHGILWRKPRNKYPCLLRLLFCFNFVHSINIVQEKHDAIFFLSPFGPGLGVLGACHQHSAITSLDLRTFVWLVRNLESSKDDNISGTKSEQRWTVWRYSWEEAAKGCAHGIAGGCSGGRGISGLPGSALPALIFS